MPQISNSSLQAYEDRIERLTNRIRSARDRAEAESDEIMTTVVEGAAAFMLGRIESSATTSQDLRIGGVEPGTWIPGVAYVAGTVVGGNTGKLLKTVGRAGLVVRAYTFGREG